MRFGLSPLQGGGSFEQTIRECERAEEAGFDSIFLGEHHNSPVLYPTPLVGPRPVQQPRPPIWFAGWAEPAIRRAARLGDAWLGGPSASASELQTCVRLYRQARQELGDAPDDGEIAALRYVFVAESLERAQAVAGAAVINFFENTYFRWPHPIVKRPPGELTIERLAEDRIILGDPATCVEHLRRLQDE